MVVALFANNQLVGTKLILSDFGGLALTHDGTGKLDQKALIRINRPPPGIRSSWGPGGRGFTLKNSKTGAIIRFSKTGRRVFPDGVKPSSGASETFASDTTRIRHLTIAGARLALVHDIARRQVRVVVNKAGQNSRIINASDVCARRFIHTTEVMPRGTKTWRVHRAAGAEKLLVARDLAPARLFSQLRAQKGRAQGLEGRQAFLIEGLFVVDLARSSGGVVEHRLKGVLVQPSGMKPISARLGPDGTLQIVGPAVSR